MYQQLESDLGDLLPRRGWHYFVAKNRVETFHVVVAVLEVLGLEATIMTSPRGKDGRFFFFVGAVDHDDDAPDFQAAREVLEQYKMLERLDRKIQVVDP